MDFGTLPPEISSALIHSGPGAGSFIEASAVWQRLGIELEDSLSGYASVLSSLTDGWQGPSSMAMIQAVEPYLAWLRTTAQQCEQLGSSMEAVAAAFELACRTVVFPVQVTSNRTRLAQLVATNWLGTNSVAIAETDAQYEGMWINNSAAMYRYEATSAQALALPQFSSPPAIASPTAAAAQASAVPAAAAATPAQSTLGDLLTSLLSTPGGFDPQAGWFGLANKHGYNFMSGGIPMNLLSAIAQTNIAQGFQNVGSDVAQGLAEGEAGLGAPGAVGLTSALSPAGSAPPAAVGVGVSIGKLTMPPAVVGLLSASKAPVQLAAAASPLAAGESGFPFLPAPMMPPVALRKRKREGRDYDDIEYGLEIKGTFMTRPPSAG